MFLRREQETKQLEKGVDLGWYVLYGKGLKKKSLEVLNDGPKTGHFCTFQKLLGSSANHPNNIDESLNTAANDKIRKYRADYNNNPRNAVAFMPAIAGTNGRLHSEFIRLLFLQDHRETDRFFPASGVQSEQSTTSGFFHFRRAAFSSMLKSKCGSILAKTSALRVNLNLDGAPIDSNSHTHPSHSQSSRLLTSALSLGVPVPRPTQCMGDV
jgi:hypothetical protein